jgi:HK97 family phage major capsid protein
MEQFMARLQDLMKQRHDAMQKADAILAVCEKEKRNTTAVEASAVDANMALVNNLTPQIQRMQGQSTIREAFGLKPGISDPENPGATVSPNHAKDFPFTEIGEFLRTREPGMLAALTEGGDLEYVVPAYQVASFIQAYPNVDVFAQAGARIVDLDGGWIPAHIPIIVSGPDVGVIAEGSGASSDQSATVYVAKLDTASKYQFLSLPTEEAWEDIAALGGALTQEGIRRCIFSVGKAATASLISSLASASATVADTGDAYQTMLDMIGAIPQEFAASSNRWMLSRKTLAAIRNTRTTGDVGIPVFNPITNQLFGYDVVLNDAVTNGKLIFGDFNSGVYLRRAGLSFLLLNEAYRSAGKVGLRFSKRAAWAFFSDAATASEAPQPLVMTAGGVDFGS